MLTVDEAEALVLARASALPDAPVEAADALGLVLAEDVSADLDLPPFDKALVDGYAVRSADLAAGTRTLAVIEEVPAGRTPSRPVGPGEATLVMTGAPLPDRADAVVMHEKTARDGDLVRIDDPDVAPGRNRLTRGREMKAGDVVLRAGATLTGVRLGLLASVGRTSVRAVPRPTVAILPTGDELVEAGARPGPGQIRNSNGPMLAGLARSAGAEAFAAATVPDEPEALRRAIAEGLRADVLILSGGVSAGRRDLVPAALEELGVARVFHKLRLKPGKPLWFGVGPARGDRPGTLVFGLPGNPVSGVVGFVLFVGPALRILAGHSTPPDPTLDVRLALPFRHSGDRPTFYPARLGPVPEDGGPRPATPLDWAGSADLRTVADADGFLLFPPGDREHPASEIVRFLPLG